MPFELLVEEEQEELLLLMLLLLPLLLLLLLFLGDMIKCSGIFNPVGLEEAVDGGEGGE